MKTYYYEFEDGYYVYTTGQIDKTQLKWEKIRHGKVVLLKVVG